LNSVFAKLIIFWRVGLKFAVSISGKTDSPGDLSRRVELISSDFRNSRNIHLSDWFSLSKITVNLSMLI